MVEGDKLILSRDTSDRHFVRMIVQYKAYNVYGSSSIYHNEEETMPRK